MKRVCFVTTSPLIVNFFLVPHLLHLGARYKMSLVVTLPGEVPLRPLPGIEVVGLEIRRRIDPWHDAAALLRLRQLLRERSFDLVHSFGPKAGLLCTTAGMLAGTRARLHTFTGQVWASRSGMTRALLKAADRWTAAMATYLLADSPSQRDFLVRERVVRRERCTVLGAGSISGVDLGRFRPDDEARRAIRGVLGIGAADPVIIYLGRLTRDKGILDMARAFADLQGSPDAVLLLVGPDEEKLLEQVRAAAGRKAPRVRYVGYTDQPERFLAAADLLCLPSYREGFGSVVIEAAATGIPAVGSSIYGVTDAIADGETGLVFSPGNVGELSAKLGTLVGDAALRRRFGDAARARAVRDFAQDRAVRALEAFYVAILGE